MRRHGKIAPPLFAVWLAGRRLSPSDREFALGDLEEEFAEVRRRSGSRAARAWYWRQALRACVSINPGGRANGAALRSRTFHMQHLMQDARFALRLLRHAPGFSLVVILTLALGIGATTAIFSVVHAALLKPLPFRDSDQLVVPQNGPTLADATPLSFPQLLEWRDGSATFEPLAGYFTWGATLTGIGEAEELPGLRCTASLFTALGVETLVGRLFTVADESRSAEPVVLLGESLWRRRFAADPAVVGRRIVLNEQAYTVIGVVPRSFRGVQPGDRARELFAPLRLTEQTAPRSLRFLRTVARLKDGQTAAQAQQQLLSFVRSAAPDADPPPQVVVTPLREGLVTNSRPVLLTLMGAVGVLLLITSANLANLLLARAVTRRREISVRLALGANRSRVVSQLLTECVVLAVIGGIAGMIVAWLGVRGLATSTAVARAGLYELELDWRIFLFAAATSLAVGMVFGSIPALHAGRMPLATQMRAATRLATGRERVRQALIIGEVALTLILLVGAGLFTRSLAGLLAVDRGFDASSVLSFSLSTTQARYPNNADRVRFFDNAIERLSHLPGVESVGLVSQLPLGGGDTNGNVSIEGRTFAPGQEPIAQKRIVSPEYFAAMGVPIKQGRVFTTADDGRAPTAIVLSEAFARKWFPDGNVLGGRVAFNWDLEGFQRVIGVVGDVKHNGLDDPANPAVYVSYAQRPDSAFTVVIKSKVEPDSLTAQIRREINALDASRPITDVRTMEAVVATSVGTRRLSLQLVSGFAILALILAVTGVYGIVSYSVQQRSREFGIRLALGAASGTVIRLVLGYGLRVALIGLALGLMGAVSLGGLVRAQLWGVEPSDPLILTLVSVGLIVVCLVACYVPARRANRLDPAAVLHSE